MKQIMQIKFLSILSLITPLFISCSNDDGLYSDTDASRSIDGKTRFSSQMENTDYEIIPIGENNYVYVPKMTSTSVTTRSAEASYKAYSTSIPLTVYDNIAGPGRITIAWDNQTAKFSLPDKYSYAYEIFQYTINDNVLTIERLSFEVLYEGKNLGRFAYTGTLRG